MQNKIFNCVKLQMRNGRATKSAKSFQILPKARTHVLNKALAWKKASVYEDEHVSSRTKPCHKLNVT